MSRLWRGWLIVLVAVVLAAGGGWWAGRVTLQPMSESSALPVQDVWAEVVEASVGRTLPYSTTLRQPSVPVAYNALAGVVTHVASGKKDVGDELYRVGNVPVRAVHAAAPMWRDLGRDMNGNDVRALQEMLGKLGYLKSSVTGKFTSSTESAVKAWQKAEGRPMTGSVARGELVAFAVLPVQITLGEGITQGAVLAGGEEAVRAPTGERTFVVKVSAEQAKLVPIETPVEVTFQEHVWEAVVVETIQTEHGGYELLLTGPSGGEVCAAQCTVLPLDPETLLLSKVMVVPQVSGPAVPAAAIRTAGDGTTTVKTESGIVSVTVRGSGQGLAVIDGVDVGERVKVGSAAASGSASSAEPAPSPSPTRR